MLLEFRFLDLNLEWAPFGSCLVELKRLRDDSDGLRHFLFCPCLQALMPLEAP